MPIRRPGDFSTGVYNRQLRSNAVQSSSHDRLHMQPGLVYCWCMCSHCWDPLHSRCICLNCPDNGGRVSV